MKLWVRECWAVSAAYDSVKPSVLTPHVGTVAYRAGGGKTCFDIDGGRGTWRPPSHMPRWASRITLEVTDVRVDNVTSICDNDARAEGFGSIDEFRLCWNALYAKRGLQWESNPWVWAATFRTQ
jgi:hypothetical protein